MFIVESCSSTEGETDVEIEEELFDHTYILSSLKAKELIGIINEKRINSKIRYINILVFLKNIKKPPKQVLINTMLRGKNLE